MSDSGKLYIETVEIEDLKLSRNSNGHNFSLGCPIQAHNISRSSQLNMEAQGKFKWSSLLTRMSDSRAQYIEMLKIKHESTRQILTAITFDSDAQLMPIIYRVAQKLNNVSSRESQMVIIFHSDVRFRRIIYLDARN